MRKFLPLSYLALALASTPSAPPLAPPSEPPSTPPPWPPGKAPAPPVPLAPPSADLATAAESGAALRLEENVWRRNSGQMTSPRALHHPGPLPAETAPIRRPSSAYLDELLEA